MAPATNAFKKTMQDGGQHYFTFIVQAVCRYTMNVISYAIHFWSKGEMDALFLRHEGFLGVMGAFLKGRPLALPTDSFPDNLTDAAGGHRGAVDAGGAAGGARASDQLSSHFVERYPMGAPFSGGAIVGKPFSSLSEKMTWVEKFVEVRSLCFVTLIIARSQQICCQAAYVSALQAMRDA